MAIPADYAERVYAGVLGKMIGVYLGRPFEGWEHRRILAELGEIHYYVNALFNVPVVVSDDDISGTFTFIRALEDYGNSREITAEQIGQSWLNYIIENRTTLWWGGIGMSTENTAFLRLKQGIAAPLSGSMRTNGRVVAEQIGAQIFVDGWAMVAPGDAELAASLAQRAASVSHDGEAIYAAQVIAAMESLAFVEKDLNKILDAAVGRIPGDCIIRRMIGDLRAYHAKEKTDWRKAFAEVLEGNYGYDKYGGNCHVVPNHGVIILALLYGGDSFQKSLMIANTCGWDTDCNSGNVGCFLGIKNGLTGMEGGPDWRGPVADRMYLSMADGGECVNDAVTQAYRICNMGRALAGEAGELPKDGAKFHFSLPGSVQGFVADQSEECRGLVTNVYNAGNCLGIVIKNLEPGKAARVGTATFISPEALRMPGYAVAASPTIYPGQRARARVMVASDIHVSARFYWRHYSGEQTTAIVYGPEAALTQKYELMEWPVPHTEHQPIVEVGIELFSSSAASISGVIKIDYVTWDGEPDVVFRRAAAGDWWRKAWVHNLSSLQTWGFTKPGQEVVLIQNRGRGLASQGTRQWRNYRVETEVTVHLAKTAGIAARVQGMMRYYALVICDDGQAKLIKALDGDHVLGRVDRAMELGKTYALRLHVEANHIRGWIDGEMVFDLIDYERPLMSGGVGMICEEGRVAFGGVMVKP